MRGAFYHYAQAVIGLFPKVLRGVAGIGLLVAVLVMSVGFGNLASAQTIFTEDNSHHAHSLTTPDQLPGQGKWVSFSVRGANVGDMLRAIGRQGGFNVMVDDSVDGHVSVDLANVPVPLALQALATQHQLHYAMQDEKTLLVYSGQTLTDRELRRTHTDIIPLQYANAAVLANILNSTVFAQQPDATLGTPGNPIGGQNNANQLLAVTPDFRTNSLIVVGTERDVMVAREHVERLDIPRSSRTWRLSHADALEVSFLLSSSVFNEGTSPLMIANGAGGGGGGAAGGGGAGGGGQAGGGGGGMMGQQPGQMPSMLRVRSESIQEGTARSISPGAGSGVAGEGGGTGGETDLRAVTKTDELVQVSPQGVLIVPDTRLNTITVLGTQHQLELAENLIAHLDQPAPQVMIEASLIELSEASVKSLAASLGVSVEKFTAALGNPNAVFQFDTASRAAGAIDFNGTLQALIQNNRAKLLSNPNIMTLHDKEAVISIVDEIVESVTVTLDDSGSVLGTETNIGNVGIVLDILPKVGANGAITMRVQPSLSTVASIQTDATGNVITLLSRREVAGQQVKLMDGQTFIMGGLINETDSNAVSKHPFLGDIPILGALARSSRRTRGRTELLIALTPHIIREGNSGPGVLPAPLEPRVINALSVVMPPAKIKPKQPISQPPQPNEGHVVPVEANTPVRGMWLGVANE